VPAFVRPLIVAMVRRQVRRNLWGHGLGRHTDDEIALLAARDLISIASFLGDKPYLLGARPGGADASVFAFVAGCLPKRFKTPIRSAAELQPNLVAYRDRLMERYFPELGRPTLAAA
jgi:glutathione S-transferase